MKDTLLTQNALTVLERRYLARDERGNVTETPDELFWRVANAIACADAAYDKNATAQAFHDMMAELRFLPNSPALINAGRPLGQLAACFVLPVGDSMQEIFDAVKSAALIHKSGGGTGFSFSRLRPKDTLVASTGGKASGPVSFMTVFNAATDVIKQGGVRRGANLGLLRVDHPDILEFIECKRDTSLAGNVLTNFNISVALTEAFMRAVESGGDYDLVDPHTGEKTPISARLVFDKLVEMAWATGEPGIAFIDRINEDNPTPQLGEIEQINACGEQPLLPYESCNLGSVNLEKMVSARDGEDARYYIDYALLGKTVDDAVHFLDNIITVNHFPLPEIEEATLRTRKIGLGVMGFANMLFRLGVPYDSDEARYIAENIMGFIHQRADAASRTLAKTRGSFPACAGSVFDDDAQPPRNATVNTIAPTGTISIIAGTSSGIEPLFALAFSRHVLDGDALIEVNPIFEAELRRRGLYTDELMREVAKTGSVKHVDGIPEDMKRVFATAHDISPEAHVRMQAAFQNHIDNAVSKTINFPREATQEDVREAFLLAWKLRLKGLCVYRDGSRESQVLKVDKGEDNAEDKTKAASNGNEIIRDKVIPPTVRPRPAITTGITERVDIGCGSLFVTCNFDERGMCEVFTSLGRAGGCPSQSEATSRLISVALRAGVKPGVLIEQLRGIRCHSTARQKAADQQKGIDRIKVLSCPDAIGLVMRHALDRVRPATTPDVQQPDHSADPCPECGQPLTRESGCVVCGNCGYSRCG